MFLRSMQYVLPLKTPWLHYQSMTAFHFTFPESFPIVKGSFCGMIKFDRHCDLHQPCYERLKKIYLSALTHPLLGSWRWKFGCRPPGDKHHWAFLSLSCHWNVPLEVRFSALSSTLERRHGSILASDLPARHRNSEGFKYTLGLIFVAERKEKLRKNEFIKSQKDLLPQKK